MDAVTTHGPLVLGYTVVCCIIHLLSGVVMRVTIPNIYNKFAPSEKELAKKPERFNTPAKLAKYKFAAQIEWDVMVTSLIYCFYMTVLYLSFTWSNFIGGTVVDHWEAVSAVSSHAISLHLASSLYETITYVLTGKGWMFYLHHVLVVLSCGSFLVTNRGHMWCCWLGLVEGTNVPLCLVSLFNKVPSAKGTLPHVASGALLWILYVVFRVVSAPLCMYNMYLDITTSPEVAWVSQDKTVDTAWLGLMIVSFVFIWGLSMYWFKLITDGLLKHIIPAGKKDGKKA